MVKAAFLTTMVRALLDDARTSRKLETPISVSSDPRWFANKMRALSVYRGISTGFGRNGPRSSFPILRDGQLSFSGGVRLFSPSPERNACEPLLVEWDTERDEARRRAPR